MTMNPIARTTVVSIPCVARQDQCLHERDGRGASAPGQMTGERRPSASAIRERLWR
jgi:hypothetical protein